MTGLLAAPAAAQQTGPDAAASTTPAAPEPECSGEAAAVLVDASSEPDLYAAFLLAGVLDTGCPVDAGDRNGDLPADSKTLLETDSLADGYVVGGVGAVPAAKLVGGLSWRRAGGGDRWSTLLIIGGAAANPQSLPETDSAPMRNGYTAVSAGTWHSWGLRPSGAAVCWGINDRDHPWDSGQASDTPSGAFTSISAGHLHTCGRRPWGEVTCWGANYAGQATTTR